MVKINYNGSDAFSGLAPVPYVGREETPIFYSNRWCLVDKITLEGQITGQCLDFEQLVERQNSLISRFSKSFQNFEILQSGDNSIVTESGIVIITESGEILVSASSPYFPIYQSPVTRVVSIDFPQNHYADRIPFSIELECYLSGLHSGVYGVIDPVNKFEFERDEEDVVTIVHTCSAKGINTSSSNSNSLTNAKNYVYSISGWDSQIAPLFISAPGSGIILDSVEEGVNRFDGSYTVTEKYRYDSLENAARILRYRVDLNSGVEGISANINGSIEGGLNSSISFLRAQYSSFDFYTAANSLYTGIFAGELNENPLDFNVVEDSFKNKIDFSINYDDSEYPDLYLIDSTTINTDKAGMDSLSFRGRFKTRGNCHCDTPNRWNLLKAYADSFDLHAFCQAKWEQYGKTTTLMQVPTRISMGENERSCELTLNAEFRELVGSEISGLDYLKYTLSVSPAIPIYSKAPVICEGQYSITDLGYDRRANFSIQGESRISECTSYATGLAAIKSEVNRLAGIYVTGIRKLLVKSNFTQNQQNERLVSFNCVWSSEADRVLDIDY